MEKKKEETFRLTAKGFLSVETGLFEKIDPIWESLARFVKEEAARNGMTEGEPCLVLKDGGYCITAERSK